MVPSAGHQMSLTSGPSKFKPTSKRRKVPGWRRILVDGFMFFHVLSTSFIPFRECIPGGKGWNTNHKVSFSHDVFKQIPDYQRRREKRHWHSKWKMTSHASIVPTSAWGNCLLFPVALRISGWPLWWRLQIRIWRDRGHERNRCPLLKTDRPYPE